VARCPECQSTNVNKLISVPSIDKNTVYRDAYGQRIWFPKDERPYFDKALRRTFNTPKEKLEFMNKNRMIMNGDYDRDQRIVHNESTELSHHMRSEHKERVKQGLEKE
jgi:hypothetical protein